MLHCSTDAAGTHRGPFHFNIRAATMQPEATAGNARHPVKAQRARCLRPIAHQHVCLEHLQVVTHEHGNISHDAHRGPVTLMAYPPACSALNEVGCDCSKNIVGVDVRGSCTNSSAPVAVVSALE
ncbi:hypothetical protein I4F81_006792 [Pyropia yezoensis]|uniref:Uncharacterized protein n=1 Tax=Pyropia yezoensis TaxID=2788 RepID=A0ACC3C385_PYRYE|nr:hypothetical protein I4F81_006792 [Neopyropia yezoensis]